MINRIYQKEEFFDYQNFQGTGIYFYKNPTKQEWGNNVAIGARGYIDIEGDLYIEGYEEKNQESNIIHSYLFALLYRENGDIFGGEEYSINILNDKLMRFGIFIQRYEDTNKIMMAESYLSNYSKEKVEEYYKLVKEKNPNLEFINKKIGIFA